MRQEWVKRCKQLMKLQGLHHDDIAPCLQVSRSAVTHYLSGRTEPNFQQLTDLAEYLNVSPQYLLYGGEDNRDLNRKLLEECSRSVHACNEKHKLKLSEDQLIRLVGHLYNEAQRDNLNVFTDTQILAVATLLDPTI
jgi:transcriptional regulator with XRE-family HTH domain